MKPIQILTLALLGATSPFTYAVITMPSPTALGWQTSDPYYTRDKYSCCGTYLTNPSGGTLGKQLGYYSSTLGVGHDYPNVNSYIPDLKPKDSQLTHAASGNDGYIEGMWFLPDRSVLFATKVMPSGNSYLYKAAPNSLVGNNAPTYDNKQSVLNMGERNGIPQANVGILHEHSLLVATINNAKVLFYGEYNTSNQNQVALWKSTDLGDTWTKVIEWNNTDSIHGLRQNPYNGWIYILMDSGIIAWDGQTAPPPDNTPLDQIGGSGWASLTGLPSVVSAGDIQFTPAPDNKVLWIPDVHSLPAGEKLFSQHANYDLTGLEAVGEVPFVNGHPPMLASSPKIPASGMVTWASGIDAGTAEKKIHVWETTDFGLNWTLRSKVDVYNSTTAVPAGFYDGLSGRELEFVPTGQSQGSKVDYLKQPYLIQNPLVTKPDDFTVGQAPNSLNLIANDDGNLPNDLTDFSFILTQPQHGMVESINNVVNYTPTLGYVGADSFTYTLKNGAGNSNTSVVTLNVIENRPVALDDTFTVPATDPTVVINNFLDITANDNLNGNNVFFNIITPPQHGGLDLSLGKPDYSPNLGFSGQDSFTYQLYALDTSSLLSNTATVTINVTNPTPVNSVANPDSATTIKKRPVTINLTGNDTNVGASKVNIVKSSEKGDLKFTDSTRQSVIFTPENNFVGQTTFSYNLKNGTTKSNTAVVTVTVNKK